MFTLLLSIWSFLSPGTLIDILHAFHVQHDGTWPRIIEETQKSWVHYGSERWEIAPIKDPHPSTSYALFTEIGMTRPSYPFRKHYDTAVILGATRPLVTARLDFLLEQTKQGLVFDRLVVLTGDRPLTLAEGDPSSCETAMIEELLQEYPWEATIIDTPTPPGQRRPNTQDTFEHWYQEDPTPGRTVVVSNQPFIPRQDGIARLFLPDTMETIGPGVSYEMYLSHNNGCAILLDELGRWLYQEIHPMLACKDDDDGDHCDW